MAQTINVDTRKLVNDLNSTMESLENIQARYERINELYESVKERWQGPAADSFIECFDTYMDNISNVQNSLSVNIEELYARCEAFTNCEQSVVLKVKGMGCCG